MGIEAPQPPSLSGALPFRQRAQHSPAVWQTKCHLLWLSTPSFSLRWVCDWTVVHSVISLLESNMLGACLCDSDYRSLETSFFPTVK